jgi:hypothetical protein
MFDTIITLLSKSVDVFLKLRKSDKAKWCSRLLQALFMLDQFREQLARFHSLLKYYVEHQDPTIREVVDDLEELRLHPMSEHMRIPAVVIKSHYVIKDERLGLSGLCLHYSEREDGIVVEFDQEQWKPGETPPEKSIIVPEDPSTFPEADSIHGFSAREYLAYLLNRRLRRLVDSLRDLIYGWSNTLRIWDDLLDMSQTKLLVIDKELYQSLVAALRVEGQFFRSIMMHCQAGFDLKTNRLVIQDTFFEDGDTVNVDLSRPEDAARLLKLTANSLHQLDECGGRMRDFIKDTFELEEILRA